MGMKPILLTSILTLALALVSAGVLVTNSGAADEPVQMAVDGDPGSPSSIDSTITINGESVFSVGVNVTSDSIAYQGYQVELEFPNALLDATGTSTYAGSSPFHLSSTA